MSATNRGAARVAQDLYPTPELSFNPLLPYLPAGDQIWEPACGDRRLVHAMVKYGLKADGNDIVHGYDFLKDVTRRFCVCTNPPFSLGLEFAQHALSVAEHTFLLLRLNFLASQKRKAWFKDHEPDCLLVLSSRPSFINGGTDATDYGWFYWGNQHQGFIHL